MPRDIYPSKKIILIVDDETELTGILKNQYLSKGLEVLSFIDGESALECILKNRVIEDIQLIILEKKLSDMDGCEFIDRIKVQGIEIPNFIFLSKYTSQYEIKQGLHKGALNYFCKPIDFEYFIEKTMQYIFI